MNYKSMKLNSAQTWKQKLWYCLPYRVRYFITGVKNLIRWFPIIYKDRDWDDHYIWQVLKFKLKNQAKYIGYHDRHLSAKRDAEIMMLCVSLIDKIQNEYYQSEHMGYHESDFNWIDCEDIPGHKQLEIIEKLEHYDDYFKKYPRIYKQVINAEKLPFQKNNKGGIAINIAYINHNRARKLLFKILEQNIERWWD